MTGPDSMFSLRGRTALVTGASTGIGAAIALALAEAGADVACHGNSRPPTATAERVGTAGRRACVLRGDVRDPATCDALVRDAVDAFGRLDILVNNAGINLRAPAVDYPDEAWDAVLAVDLSAVFRLCRAMGRHVMARGGGGRIVNIASLLSFQGGVTVPAYAAAKGGVAQLTRALANEWAAHGLNVNAIAPGYVATELTEPLRRDAERNRQISERIPAGRWARPEDVAGAVVFLAAPASDYVHGHVLVVDGGWMAR